MQRSSTSTARSGDRCPACGGRLSAWRSVPSSEPTLGGARFELLRCEACGTAQTAGPAVVGLHDSGAYRSGAPRLHRFALPILRAFDARRLSLLAPLAPPGRGLQLLDVGAGRGRFVAAARARGYDARGIEPSLRGAGAAASIGAPVERAGVQDAVVADGSLDAVTAWHVLEHLDDPGGALGRIAAWVRPGGALLVGVPNLGSVQAQVAGERWYHLDVPRHRAHFTLAGLDALLRAHDFEPVRTTHLLVEHNPFGMWQSLVNRVTHQPSYLYNLLKRNARVFSLDLPITVAALAFAPLAAAAEAAAGIARRGGTIAVLARRGE
jgi:SAM-dependent methyltransferase